MRSKLKKCLCVLTAAAVMLGGIQLPAVVKAQESKQAEGRAAVTVSGRDEFLKALREKKSPITVNGLITIQDDAEASGRMRPVKIPGGTVIQGNGANSYLNARSPIQIEGDNVTFKNIKLHFESSNALGSVPHRELYLAGHSLTLDNVDTYLEGGANLGGLGGNETELLPTVYAGGYPGSTVGRKASLTVTNSNDKTIFDAIYMGHGTENGNHTSYQGEAVLNLDEKATVRKDVNASHCSNASINMIGKQYSYARTKKFVGNENTTLTLNTVSIAEAAIDGVGNVVLDNQSCLSPNTKDLQNVTLKNGACLDLTGVKDANISGDFTGAAEGTEKGILVLNENKGSVKIHGNITGITQFQTDSKYFPGAVISGHSYIYSEPSNGKEDNFVLAQKSMDMGFKLVYSNGVWTGEQDLELRKIGRIEILASPSKVKVDQIKAEEDNLDKNVYFEIKWYDKNGKVIDNDEAIGPYCLYYDIDYILCVKTAYWDSNEEQSGNDWFQWIGLFPSEEYPGRFYLQNRGEEAIKTGEYTFLFLSESTGGEQLETIDDVKRLKNTVMAEQKVTITEGEDSEPGHIHTYKGEVTEEATCQKEGVRTYTCTFQECGERYQGKTAVSDHNYQEKVAQESTCTEPGLIEFVCSGCQTKYTKEKPALGHKEVIDQAVEPTETEDGKTEGSHCGVCNKVLKPQEVIPATGHKHSYQEEETKKATCVEEGIKTYTCSCGDKKTEKIPLADHQYTEKCTPATVNSNGKIQQICSVCSDVKSSSVIYSPRIAWGKTDYSYDGKVKTPSVTVQDTKGKALRAGTDYQIVHAKGRKNPGVYTTTVVFRGHYSGKAAESFKIRPKKTSLKKVSAKSKGMQVSWKKQTVQIDGYQLQYSTSGSFKGKTTKLTTAKKSAVSKKISKLKGKKKYYVRIRTYKTVKVNGKKVTLYSNWSAKKYVKTKK